MTLTSKNTTFTNICRIKQDNELFIRIIKFHYDTSQLRYLATVCLTIPGEHEHFLDNIWDRPKITHNRLYTNRVFTHYKWNRVLPCAFTEIDLLKEMEKIMELGDAILLLEPEK